jgi:hypothetical protein
VEGNGYATVRYPANGEASDWMLGKHGIFAMSPELGTTGTTQDFFLNDSDELKLVLKNNYKWIEYMMMSMVPKFKVQIHNLIEPHRIFFN